MRRSILLSCLLLSGCATSFTNVVKVSVDGKPDGRPRLAAIADKVGLDNKLSANLVEPAPNFRRWFKRPPGHVYLFEFRQEKGRDVGLFIHTATMIQKGPRGEEPERQFIEEAKAAFGRDTVTASAEGKGSFPPEAQPPFVAFDRSSPETKKQIADLRLKIDDLDEKAARLKEQTTAVTLTPEQQRGAVESLKQNRKEKAALEADIQDVEHPETYWQPGNGSQGATFR